MKINLKNLVELLMETLFDWLFILVVLASGYLVGHTDYDHGVPTLFLLSAIFIFINTITDVKWEHK